MHHVAFKKRIQKLKYKSWLKVIWKILSVGEPLLQAEITSKPKARLST